MQSNSLNNPLRSFIISHGNTLSASRRSIPVGLLQIHQAFNGKNKGKENCVVVFYIIFTHCLQQPLTFQLFQEEII